VMGGGDLLRQYLDAGVVDELTLTISPVLLGDGKRLCSKGSVAPISLSNGPALSSRRGPPTCGSGSSDRRRLRNLCSENLGSRVGLTLGQRASLHCCGWLH
jgi:riboflavin biosynthesis pyrimidine reductase